MNCKIKFAITSVVLIIFIVSIWSQYFYKTRAIGEDYYRMVKQYDEFVKRFNCEPQEYMDAFIARLEVDFDWRKNRSIVISSLINVDIDSIKTNKQLLDFAEYIVNNNIRIDNTSFFIFAEANFKYKNKDTTVLLKMKLDGGNEEGWSWIIFDVESPIFAYGDVYKDSLLFIGAKDNEVNFLDLHVVLGKNYNNYTPQNYKPDNLTTFLYLTSNKELIFQHMKRIEYIHNIGAYKFKVNEIINENIAHSGYLITSVTDSIGCELIK